MNIKNLIDSLASLGLADLANTISSIEKFAELPSDFSTEKKVLSQVINIINYYGKLSLNQITVEEIRLPSFYIETSTKIVKYSGETLTGLTKKDVLSYAISNFLETFVNSYMKNKQLYLSSRQLNAYRALEQQVQQTAKLMQIKYNRLLGLKPSKKDKALFKKTSKIKKEDIQAGIRHLKTQANEINAVDSYLVQTYLPALQSWIEAHEGAEEEVEYLSRLRERLKVSKLDSLKKEVENNIVSQLDISPEDFSSVLEFVNIHVSDPEISFRSQVALLQNHLSSLSLLKKSNDSNQIKQPTNDLLSSLKRLEESQSVDQSSLEDKTTSEKMEIDRKIGDYGDKILGKYRSIVKEHDISINKIQELLRKVIKVRSTPYDKEGNIYSPQLILAAKEFTLKEWKARYAALLVMAVVAFKRNKYQPQTFEDQEESPIFTFESFQQTLNNESSNIEKVIIQKLYSIVESF